MYTKFNTQEVSGTNIYKYRPFISNIILRFFNGLQPENVLLSIVIASNQKKLLSLNRASNKALKSVITQVFPIQI